MPTTQRAYMSGEGVSAGPKKRLQGNHKHFGPPASAAIQGGTVLQGPLSSNPLV